MPFIKVREGKEGKRGPKAFLEKKIEGKTHMKSTNSISRTSLRYIPWNFSIKIQQNERNNDLFTLNTKTHVCCGHAYT